MLSNVSPYSAFREPSLRDLTDTPPGGGSSAKAGEFALKMTPPATSLLAKG
jgi:hypothetical protein